MDANSLTVQEKDDKTRVVGVTLTSQCTGRQEMKQTTETDMIQGRSTLECELVFEEVQQGAQVDCAPFSKCGATTCFSQYPLRALLPSVSSRPNCPCQWVLLMSFGGGLVSGDLIRSRISVGHRCCVLLTTQSFPKVYKSDSPDESSEQRFNFFVDSGGFLAVLSDPVVCYKDADFLQTQTVRLDHGANLILLDWYTAGRTARGEWWDFHRVRSKTTIQLQSGQILLRESLDMRGQEECGLSAKLTMGRYGVTGICIILGPYLYELTQTLLKSLSIRDPYGQNPARDVVVTASPLPSAWNEQDGPKPLTGCLLRFAATTTTLAYRELSRLLEPLFETFGEDPFQGKF